MNNIFMDTQGLYQRRRAFNMSFRNDLTCNLGEIIPVYWQDLIPNTSWAARVHALVRFMPLVAPMLTNVDLYVHFWEGPLRTLYGEDFTHVITGELESEEWTGVFWKPSEILRRLTASGHANEQQYLLGDGSLFDLLGYDKSLFFYTSSELLPIPSPGKLNARKFIMYFRLMHDWYSNENVEPWDDFKENFDWKTILDVAEANDGDISGVIVDFVVNCFDIWKTAGYLPHQWPKDYYTSALPTLQYGLPTYFPLGDSAPVNIDFSNVKLQGRDPGTPGVGNNYPVFGFDGSPLYTGDPIVVQQANPPSIVDFTLSNDSEDPKFIKNVQGALVNNDATGSAITATADLSEATAITVNEFRITNALQVFKERELRYGRKPQEYYKGFFGVTPGDLRLQMPKFLGGGRMPVNISDIEQTSQTTSDSPQGNLTGKGTGIAAGFARAHCFAPEETLVMGVAWLMPKVLYAESLSRHDTKLNDRFDYYNPSFAHIGEQEVYNYEVFAGTYGRNLGSREFGYQPRYTEYRFHNSEIHGDLKGSLSYWTLARIFNSQPALNANFIYMQPEVLNRVFAVREALVGLQRNVILSIQFQAACIQPLSRYGTPGLMP